MSDFYREENIHQRASIRFESLSDSVTKPLAYADDHISSFKPGDAGLFVLAYQGQPAVAQKLVDNLTSAKTLLKGVSDRFNEAEQAYDATTDDALVKVDTIFAALGEGASAETSVSDGGSGTTFGSGDANAVLATPEEATELNWFLQQLIGLGGGLTSPGEWFNTILGWICGGTGPIDWVADQFTGDYQKVHQAGDATKKVGEWYAEMESLLTADASALFRGWTGEAADSSMNYLRGLIEAFAEQPTALSSLGNDLTSSAQSLYFAGQAVVGLITSLIDLVIILVPMAIAAAAASSTGIGAVAWGPVLTGVWTGMTMWQQALLVHGLAVSGAYLIAGLLGSNLSMVMRMEQLTMPGAA